MLTAALFFMLTGYVLAQDYCQNLSQNCGASPGWPFQSMCDTVDYVRPNCPEFCGDCTCATDPRGPCQNGGNRGGNPANWGPNTCDCNCVGNWAGEFCEVCTIACANGGQVDPATCTCVCPTGYYGDDCSVTCKNTDPKCGASPGWPLTDMCTTDYVQEACQEFCGVCSCADDPRGGCQNGGTRGGNPANWGDDTCNCNCPGYWVGDFCETCSLHCFNGGQLDAATCTCTCPAGWDGEDCSDICQDSNINCGANPGWPSTDMCTIDYVAENCHAFCSICTPANVVIGDCTDADSQLPYTVGQMWAKHDPIRQVTMICTCMAAGQYTCVDA
ncbi:FAT4 [Branchiostoma lanceolatum]|uniref:FAT4 protein n=1 Tax=Branchiostoma lanceolatum TaxID=7740 RepID=A0A8J9V6T0_BRALA|nr:FAT4 [Branchiostoma lanceolatum]